MNKANDDQVLAPVTPEYFEQSKLNALGIGTKNTRGPERTLSVKDQEIKRIFEEQLAKGEPLWCPQELEDKFEINQ